MGTDEKDLDILVAGRIVFQAAGTASSGVLREERTWPVREIECWPRQNVLEGGGEG